MWTNSSTSFADSRAMSERWRRFLAPCLLWLCLVWLAVPAAMLAAPLPGESCPDTTPVPAASRGLEATDAVCGEGTIGDNPGGGGTDISGLIPIIVAAAGGALLALVAIALVLRRRTAVPLAPADPGEWWTCRKCGSTNVIDSPRCYACGEWQA